jgi:hypothetical protein
MIRKLMVLAVFATFFCTMVHASDADVEKGLAKGLADSAAEFKTKGKLDQAKLYFFKALFHDENCAQALYELGQIYETENDNINALNFFVRANQQFGNAGDPLSRAKSKDCEKHILKLSPYTTQFNTAMDDYAQELGKIAAKNTDTLTLEEAHNKVTVLNLSQYVAADKMPESLKFTPKAKPATPQNSTMRRPFVQNDEPAVVTNVPPDVERALKAAGWTTITGTWKKKSEGVYEVTDGKVESKIANGVMQVLVPKGGTGTIRMFCRNSNHEWMGDSMTQRDASRYATGFGYIIKDGEAKQYAPSGGWTDMENNNLPDLDKTNSLTQAKNRFTVQVMDNKLELTLNEFSPRKMSAKITHEGPFTILVVGTMIIETPQVKGF